jgi:hypothetical protein
MILQFMALKVALKKAKPENDTNPQTTGVFLARRTGMARNQW